MTKTKKCRKKSLSFPTPWELQTPISPSRAPDPSLLLGDPRLLIDLPRHWLWLVRQCGNQFPDQGRTQARCIGRAVLAAGPPARSLFLGSFTGRFGCTARSGNQQSSSRPPAVVWVSASASAWRLCGHWEVPLSEAAPSAILPRWELGSHWRAYWIPRTAAVKVPQTEGFNQKLIVPVLDAQRLVSGCWQSHAPSECSG